jgi:hypothetical protein
MKKWFTPGRSTGWSKDDSEAVRRRSVLKARRGNPLKAGRALMALANVTRDEKTAKRARSDALYFFKLNRQKKSR